MRPSGGGTGAGLKEKRVLATSSLPFTHSASQYGDKNKSAWDDMLLDDAAEWHNNHGSDPGTDTLAMADEVTLIMEMLRPAGTAMAMVDTVHVILDGYHPAGEDLIQHPMIAGETMVAGQPVYVVSNNTVNLANATVLATANTIGLVCVGGSATDTVTIQTDGAVYLEDWTAIIGATELTPGALYYLDTTDGLLTTDPPIANGNVIVTMGTALNTKTIDIEVNEVASL
jgi:hypothetical protein